MYNEQNPMDYQIDNTESENSELDSLSSTTTNELSDLKKGIDDGEPGKFEFLRDSTDGNYLIYSYVIENGGTPEDIKSEVILSGLAKQGTEIQVTEANAHPYDSSKHFFGGETVYIRIRKSKDDSEGDAQETKTSRSEAVENEDQSEESLYKGMIEKQTVTEKIRYGNRENPELTLTIDDGNSYEDVEAILDILKEENIKATFFIKGDRLDFEAKKGKNNKELRIRAKNEGHQICCHTYSHLYLSKKRDITDLTSGGADGNSMDINTRSNNVKRLLGDDYYNKIKVSEIGKGIDFPKSISSDVLLETEILMWEKQIKNVLGEEYLQKLKREFPFIRLPGGNGLERQKNIDVLKRLGYLSIYWSDDFLNKKDSNGRRVHDSIDEMKVQNGGIPLFHFKGKTEQGYMKAYIKKAKQSGKTFKRLSDTLEPDTEN